MCDLCHRRVCPSACPNADDPIVGACAYCGDVIRRSEQRLRIDGADYHRDCLEGLSLEPLLDELEITYESEGTP